MNQRLNMMMREHWLILIFHLFLGHRFLFLLVGLLCLFFVLHLFIYLCWSIIALQCCVGFCHTTSWISYIYMYTHRRQPTRLPRPWGSPGKNTGVGCHFLLQCMKVKSESEVAQSYPTLSDPMDCSVPGSSIHGVFQARVLEWGAIAFSVIRTLAV